MRGGAGFGILSSVSQSVNRERPGPESNFSRKVHFSHFTSKSDFFTKIVTFCEKVLNFDNFEISAKTAPKSLNIPLVL